MFASAAGAVVSLIALSAGEPAPAAGTAKAALIVREYAFDVPEGPGRSLAQHTVTALLEDPEGFLWIATQGGLHRFDGESLRLWRAEDGLPEGFVTSLALGASGKLWVGGSAATLARIELASGRVLPAPETLTRVLETTATGPVTALHEDADGTLWVALSDRVLLHRPDADTRELLDLSERHPRALPIRDLAPSRRGVLLAVADGLLELDREGRVRRIGQVLEQPARCILARRDGSLLLGTQSGVLVLNDGVWQPIPGLPTAPVSDLVEDGDGGVWIASPGAGLWLWREGELRRFRRESHLRGLHDDFVQRLLVSRQGVLWIGSATRGVAHTDPRGTAFAWLAEAGSSARDATAGNVRAIAEDALGGLWIGFDSAGLKRFDLAAGTVEDHGGRLRQALALDPELPLRVSALQLDGDGRLWIATPQGLLRREPDGSLTRLQESGPPTDPRALLLAADGSLWVGYREGGLRRYAPDGRVRPVGFAGAKPPLRRQPMVLALFEDRDRSLWVGTAAGLARVAPDGEAAVFVTLEVDGREANPSEALVRDFLLDREERLWLATHGGLLRVERRDPQRAQARRLEPPARAHGDPTVYSLLEARDGALWLAGNAGLWRFDPTAGSWRHFDRRHGLEALEFNGRAALRLRDGRLVFGSIGGAVLERARRPREVGKPPIRISAVELVEEAGRRLRLEPAPAHLELRSGHSVIGFHFGAVDPAALAAYRFAWRLAGLESSWTPAGAVRSASFSHLPPGRYRFELIAESDEFGESKTSVALTVHPPWWATWTAISAYAAGALALLASLLAVQRRRRLARVAHERALAEREQRLRLALWGSGDEYWDWDIVGGRFYRLGADLLLGFRESEQVMDSDEWRRRAIHPEDRERVERLLAEHLAGSTAYFESEHRIRGADGRWVWVRSRGKVVERDAEGRPVRMAGTARDVTEVRRSERDRRIAAEVIRCMSEGVAVLDPSFRFLSVNPAFTRITGYGPEELLGEDAGILDGPMFPVEERRRLREQLSAQGHWHGEIWQRRRDGTEILCEIESHEVLDAEGKRAFFVTVLSDVTDRRRTEQELRYLANYDTLTGLPNRTLLGERLAQAIVRARRRGTRVAVLFLDLDRFKHINDSLGHAVGDRLLRAAGERLRRLVRESDTVARLGGDEFTVLLEDVQDLAQVEQTAERLLEAFREPLVLDGGQEVIISPSIGIALYPDHGDVPSDLLKFADNAMYQAKERGRNTFQFYVEAMDLEARRRALMGAALRRALERNEFSLAFQPKLDLRRRRICGLEALLRWRSADFGWVPPASFVPLAEESGLIVPIGEWVLREAATQLRRFDAIVRDRLSMAVNVSVMQLFRGDLDRRLARLLAETRTPPERIELELTESTVMANPEQSIRTLRALKSIGVRLAIDDFGTGYSSLAYLKRLPLDTLKIDKTFVSDLIADPEDEAITATIIAMAHALELEVVAEGVESAEQLQYLRSQGCDIAQGFHIGEPMAAEACAEWLRERSGVGARP